MTTLYLDRKNLSLRADSSALVCYENDKRVATVPLKSYSASVSAGI